MVAKVPAAGVDLTTESSITLKNPATADNSTFTLNLQTAEADIAQDDVLGKINFQAPNEGTGTDAILVAASIQATSEGDFSSSSNATKLEFMTGSSEAAATKMTISSAGLVGINTAANSSYYYNDLVVNSGDEGGITILDTSSGQSALAFADGTSGTARYMGRVLYNHNTNTMEIGAGGSTDLKIDGDNHMKNAAQPAFYVKPSSAQNNIASGGWVTVVFGTEVFDQNSDFASNVFTAPKTGRYLLSAWVYMHNVDSAANSYEVQITTSNRNQGIYTIDPGVWSGDSPYYGKGATMLADMDASDTASVRVYQDAGSDQTDINATSYFSGVLIC